MLKYKQGAASFYIVAISTLILVILATSFATAILAAITRSSNDELAQSAYDSAMAGVEEAKLAYANYRNCINIKPSLLATDSLDTTNPDITCQDIVYWATHPDGDPNNPNYNPCDMVALILGRVGKTGNSSRSNKNTEIGEVSLEQTNNGKTGALDQAYTCVKFNVNPNSLADSITAAQPYKIVKLTPSESTDCQNGDEPNCAQVSSIDTITLSWGISNGNGFSSSNYSNIASDNEEVIFPPRMASSKTYDGTKSSIPSPATISFQIIQAPFSGFTFNELNSASSHDATNRSTMYFVPTNEKNTADVSGNNISANNRNYIGIYNATEHEDENYLSASQISSTNNLEKNYPYVVYCNDADSDYACSVTMDLPKPLEGNKRTNDAFYFVVSLAYGGPDTVFSIDFTCRDGKSCSFTNQYYKATSNNQSIDQAEVLIDSTGRAGDMYKRIETYLRTEVSAKLSGYPFYAIQANTINKPIAANIEWGIDVPEPPEPEPEEPEPEPDDTCPADTPYMQDWDGADALAVNENKYLRDQRDNQCYGITKLRNGQVWMTDNLNLAGGTTLTPETSNVTENYTLPASLQSIFGTTEIRNLTAILPVKFEDPAPGTQYSHTPLVLNTGTKTCNDNPCYSYYSYAAATAGQDPAIGNATTDICPAGWRLPTTSDWAKFAQVFGTSSTLTGAPFYAVYSGSNVIGTVYDALGWHYMDSSTNLGAAYCSSTAFTDSNSRVYDNYAYEIGFNWVTGKIVSMGWSKANGYAIRCLLKQ